MEESQARQLSLQILWPLSEDRRGLFGHSHSGCCVFRAPSCVNQISSVQTGEWLVLVGCFSANLKVFVWANSLSFA